MLRMSKMTDYGIVLLTELARGEGETRTARELAERTRVPLPSVSKVLKGLQGAGLLVSHRGASGGYGLARPAREIPLTEIITALEGPVSLTECGAHGAHPPAGSCELERVCQVRGHWRVINRTIQDALGRLSLADLCAPVPRLIGLNTPNPNPATVGGVHS
ncbi:SUF system Fe-S cluster assembly regulator [Archangium sp.]|jgi:FeS assembly SUF system regulator|uniref:SUF system Fe-S cluster assembly regulator n=1 Tax=Archangium sp. TaxID=1872627 RepID=UPI00286B6A50|nr:SUF system Fe-S cluster assembly regulator [Archangium sp.]HLM43655.1 SUF system Fe-S cluster assembly regulator [Myxococcaceae bacterium]HZH76324.1 SUF system Fe-S cluster assembly regulator [Archangium sp.]